jgi:uncharacterized delta-60 repeat protein
VPKRERLRKGGGGLGERGIASEYNWHERDALQGVRIVGKGRKGRLAGVVFLALALSGAICVLALAAPGALDPTFSGDGKLTTNFTRTHDGANGVAIQADGKIVVAGQAGGYPARSRFALARYRAGGTLDPTFGGTGKLTTRFAGSAYASDVAIQADGRIVVVGQANDKFALARYDRDETLDSTFNGDGKRTTSFLPLDTAGAASVAVQADGKIVVAGSAWCEETLGTCPAEEESSDFAVARYDVDGTLDASFSEDGRVTTDIRGTDDGWAVALQADGKIVVAGGIGQRLSGSPEFGLVRYQADGTLDSTFGDGGKVTTNFGSSSGDGDAAYDLVIQADGKIVAAGRGDGRFALARYNADGTPDATFSSDGKLMTNFTTRPEIAFGVALQATGKIVAAGRVAGRFALARYKPDGTLDATFSGDGKVTTNFTTRSDQASDVAVQANGKIVLAGWAGAGGSDPRFALARYRGG